MIHLQQQILVDCVGTDKTAVDYIQLSQKIANPRHSPFINRHGIVEEHERSISVSFFQRLHFTIDILRASHPETLPPGIVCAEPATKWAATRGYYSGRQMAIQIIFIAFYIYDIAVRERNGIYFFYIIVFDYLAIWLGRFLSADYVQKCSLALPHNRRVQL